MIIIGYPESLSGKLISGKELSDNKYNLYFKFDDSNSFCISKENKIPEDFKLIGSAKFNPIIGFEFFDLDNNKVSKSFCELNEVDKNKEFEFLGSIDKFYNRPIKKESIWTKIKSWFKHNI